MTFLPNWFAHIRRGIHFRPVDSLNALYHEISNIMIFFSFFKHKLVPEHLQTHKNTGLYVCSCGSGVSVISAQSNHVSHVMRWIACINISMRQMCFSAYINNIIITEYIIFYWWTVIVPYRQYSIVHVLYSEHYNFPVYIITYLMFLYFCICLCLLCTLYSGLYAQCSYITQLYL